MHDVDVLRSSATVVGSDAPVTSIETIATDDVITPGDVYVAPSPVHGRGVFAGRSFEVGDVIEECPVLVVQADQFEALDTTDLYGFSFEWEDGAAVALGYGSLYNHSWQPNARYDHDYDRCVIVYTAVRPIAAGDEIKINYGGEPEARAELWFDTEEPAGP